MVVVMESEGAAESPVIKTETTSIRAGPVHPHWRVHATGRSSGDTASTAHLCPGG
jgi:hypothetical protein